MVGNLSNYTKNDIVRALFLLKERISRKDLTEKLELGEGTVRTILDILMEKGLTESIQQGHVLNKKGIAKLESMEISAPKRTKVKVYPQYKCVGIIAKNVTKRKKDYEYRDSAIKNGCEAAIILDDSLKVEGENFSYLKKEFELSKKDLLILGFAESYKLAENGVMGVVMQEFNNSY